MTGKISVVINTFNEEKTIARAVNSVLWADEILVCDMHSQDQTPLLAKKLGAKVIFIKHQPFVEMARNLAISKAEHEWILILDPDEEVPDSLAQKLQEIVRGAGVTTFVEIPRRNIIFSKWLKASMWWPDYNIRFFKQGVVSWSGVNIHRPPKTEGQGIKLPIGERYAITHYHYSDVDQFLHRIGRYTAIQAKELVDSGYEFAWPDLIHKPVGEFLGRFFANRGFEDGLHGLALSLLQAFSFLIVYLKVWEMSGFKEQGLKLDELNRESDQAGSEIKYWFKYGNLSKDPLKQFVQRIKNKLS